MAKKSPAETAEYLSSHLKLLEHTSREAGLQTLAYLIGLAVLEAENIRGNPNARL